MMRIGTISGRYKCPGIHQYGARIQAPTNKRLSSRLFLRHA
jgi:hypothetical protein